MTEDEKRTQADEDAREDLELSDDDSANVTGGAKQKEYPGAALDQSIQSQKK
jgi:hypothetical protein